MFQSLGSFNRPGRGGFSPATVCPLRGSPALLDMLRARETHGLR
ncbi:hypothetical protein DFR30_1717 [Thiogranum longum]|uniref:Uncharacterized protein n=1 Tax=Thiogranum longum TaxID=1537524 RepID=A0A4R1HGI7_9GAMM|nr:hypothetical protein DFR30_1717 [Thiogranum longum]